MSSGYYEEAQGLDVGALSRGLLRGISSVEQAKSLQSRLGFVGPNALPRCLVTVSPKRPIKTSGK